MIRDGIPTFEPLEGQIIEKKDRPLGVTILAIFQIIGTFILIFYSILNSLNPDETANMITGFPISEFIIIYSLIMIPVSLLLAYGLFTGKEWARFSSVLFQITSLVTAAISFNVINVIISIYIIYYLRKPHVKKFFNTEQGIKKNIKATITVGIIILLLLNSYIALMINPFIMYNRIGEMNKITDKKYYGTWIDENETRNIEITFHSKKTFFFTNDTRTYSGTWDHIKDTLYLKLNWTTGTTRYISMFYDNDELQLIKKDGENAFFTSIYLTKKS